jgi:hypothetical protein
MGCPLVRVLPAATRLKLSVASTSPINRGFFEPIHLTAIVYWWTTIWRGVELPEAVFDGTIQGVSGGLDPDMARVAWQQYPSIYPAGTQQSRGVIT